MADKAFQEFECFYVAIILVTLFICLTVIDIVKTIIHRNHKDPAKTEELNFRDDD